MSFWKQLQTLIKSNFDQKELSDQVSSETETHFACAILLVEVARSDFDVSPEEVATIQQVLQKLYSVNEAHSQKLVATAIKHVEELTCLHDFTKTLDSAFSNQEKENLITALWQVAYADGILHDHETHWIKRIGDLLHVQRSYIFKCKEKALQHP